MFGVVIVIGFVFLNWGIGFALSRWGEKWEIRGVTDVALLPLAMIVFSTYLFLMTPVTNTITRDMECEADMYGLTARQPDGEARVDLMLGEEQAGSRPARGASFLRPSQRPDSHHRSHALESGAS
jgi:STE24 endopeptidase